MLNFLKQGEEHWISISDLMAGLMMVFLLIAIAYMHDIAVNDPQSGAAMREQAQKYKKQNIDLRTVQQRVRDIALTYEQKQFALYEKLYEEFAADLPKWHATIDKNTLSVRFNEPDILFQAGRSDVSPRFQQILQEFFPRYLEIIFSNEFRDSIAEIRIEGHTSSEWNYRKSSADESYFNNMQLSQERTRAVLSYCYNMIGSEWYKDKIRKYITANGLSSSKPILTVQGEEDRAKSRRVEFRTVTNSEREILRIIEESRNSMLD